MAIQYPTDQNCTLSCNFSEMAEWSVTLEVTYSYSDSSAFRGRNICDEGICRRLGGLLHIGRDVDQGDFWMVAAWHNLLADRCTHHPQKRPARDEIAGRADNV